MSRIGRLPITVPGGVEVDIEGQLVTVKGPKGTLSHTVAEPIKVDRDDDGTLHVARPDDERESRSLHGLSRTLIANMVIGVTDGLHQDARDRRHRLPRAGQGQRPRVRARLLATRCSCTPPNGISFAVETPTRFAVEGIDKQQVGEVAANIRKLRKPDPYKGKGVRYQGEVVRRKAGKAGKK